MPAYFNISLQFKREDIYDNFMNDFYTALNIAGLKFLGVIMRFLNNKL